MKREVHFTIAEEMDQTASVAPDVAELIETGIPDWLAWQTLTNFYNRQLRCTVVRYRRNKELLSQPPAFQASLKYQPDKDLLPLCHAFQSLKNALIEVAVERKMATEMERILSIR